MPLAARDAAARRRLAADPADDVRPLPPGVVRRARGRDALELRPRRGRARRRHRRLRRGSAAPRPGARPRPRRHVEDDLRALARPSAPAGRRSTRSPTTPRAPAVVDYWQRRLAEGTQVEVPDAHVQDAARALLVQNLTQTWRYSVGNPYEQFSFPEGVDVAQVLDEWGHADVARRDPAHVADAAAEPVPELEARREAARLGTPLPPDRRRGGAARGDAGAARLRRARSSGSSSRAACCGRERYSSDIKDEVYGLHTNAVVWQGLRELAARVGRDRPPRRRAATRRTLAARLERGLRRAVAASQRRLPDGTLFVPVRLLDRRDARTRSLTQERAGSYWNLVAPYALASGLFAPREPAGARRARVHARARLAPARPRPRRRLRALRPRRPLPRLRHRPGLRHQHVALPRRHAARPTSSCSRSTASSRPA